MKNQIQFFFPNGSLRKKQTLKFKLKALYVQEDNNIITGLLVASLCNKNACETDTRRVNPKKDYKTWHLWEGHRCLILPLSINLRH